HPRLSHEIVPEAAVTFLAHQVKPGLLVDVPGRVEHVVGPEHDLAIAYLPGEADAFADQARPDPETTRGRLDQEQAQLGHAARPLDEEDRADDFALALRDPAALALGVVALDELGDDVGDQRLEARIPPVFSGVQYTVAMHHPSHVAGPVASHAIRGSAFVLGGGPGEPRLARVHRGH